MIRKKSERDVVFKNLFFIFFCGVCVLADELQIAKKYLYETKDIDLATEYFKKAALNGNQEAARYIGDIYLYRTSKKAPNIKRFYKKAELNTKIKNPAIAFSMQVSLLDLYIKAVTKNDAKAAYMLGLMFMQGTFTMDKDEAMEWFELAQILGHPNAKYYLNILQSDKNSPS